MMGNDIYFDFLKSEKIIIGTHNRVSNKTHCLGPVIHVENIPGYCLINSRVLVMGKLSKHYEMGQTLEEDNTVELYKCFLY